jgi:hypothetical protein
MRKWMCVAGDRLRLIGVDDGPIGLQAEAAVAEHVLYGYFKA